MFPITLQCKSEKPGPFGPTSAVTHERAGAGKLVVVELATQD